MDIPKFNIRLTWNILVNDNNFPTTFTFDVTINWKKQNISGENVLRFSSGSSLNIRTSATWSILTEKLQYNW